MVTGKLQKRLFKNYGVGTGLRSAFYSEFLSAETRPRSVEWLEVISESFMHGQSFEKTRGIRMLEKLRADYPIALHGVSLSIGSMHGLDLDYLKKLKQLVDRIEPIVVSDHLCWTRIHGVQTHDLNPLPYTPALVSHVADKIKQVQDLLGRRMLIENVSSYLEFEQSTMSEEEFVSRVVEAADCGILLDINNVFVSSKNHGFDAQAFLSRVPHQRVGQIHIAGHTEADGILIDTHDQPVRDEVWTLFQWYGQQFGHASSMVERDGNFSNWKAVEDEVLKMKSLYRAAPEMIEVRALDSVAAPNEFQYSEQDQKKWVASLIAVFELQGVDRDRFNVYEEAFWIRVNEALSEDFVELRNAVISKASEEAWDELVYDVISANPPRSWSLGDLGEVFIAALRKQDHKGLSFAERDWARIRAFFLTHAEVSGVETDFAKLATLDEASLAKVVLAMPSSTQILFNQNRVLWANSSAKIEEKSFSTDEWKGIVALLEQTPMLQMNEYQAHLQEWVRIGLVSGWMLEKRTPHENNDPQKEPQKNNS